MVVVTSTMVGDKDGAGVRWHVLAADVDNEGQGAVLQLIAAALRLRLADADADGVGYSRGRARHRAQPVQVQLRQLRQITSSRMHAVPLTLCAECPSISTSSPSCCSGLYNPESLSYRVCLSPPVEAHTSTKHTSSASRVQPSHSPPFCRFVCRSALFGPRCR